MCIVTIRWAASDRLERISDIFWWAGVGVVWAVCFLGGGAARAGRVHRMDGARTRAKIELASGQQSILNFPWVRIKNLASKALSLAAQRIRKDWEERYGYGPVLLETFAEVTRYRGTCYQAANWIRLGDHRCR